MKALMIGALAWALPLAASATDLSGPWAVKGEFGPQFKYTLLCGLNAGGQGPCTAILGPLLNASGRLSDGALKFGYETDFNGGGVRLDYYGRVGPDGTVRGSLKANTSNGVFEATPLPIAGTDQVSAWWINVGLSDQMKYSVVCLFRADGEKLKGPCAIAQGPILRATGTADGARVSIAYDTTFQGRPTHVVYAGEVQADGSLKGTIRSGEAVGAFTAARPH